MRHNFSLAHLFLVCGHLFIFLLSARRKNIRNSTCIGSKTVFIVIWKLLLSHSVAVMRVKLSTSFHPQSLADAVQLLADTWRHNLWRIHMLKLAENRHNSS